VHFEKAKSIDLNKKMTMVGSYLCFNQANIAYKQFQKKRQKRFKAVRHKKI
jgi:hypothetical protein